MMRQTLQPSLIAGGSGRTILIAGGERGVIYDAMMYGLSKAVKEKAQQYGVWREVREWAKEHPLAVKWLNQDTDMIHSIAETGWTRWIVGDGTGYFDSGIYFDSKDVEISTKVRTASNISVGDTIVGVLSQVPNLIQFGYCYPNADSMDFHFGSGDFQAPFKRGEVHNVSYKSSDGYVLVDGNRVNAGEVKGTVPSVSIPIFAYNLRGSITGKFKGSGMFVNIKVGETSKSFLPYRSPETGQMELLDIVTGTLATRVGTFTESIEKNQ